jgi:D-glycero-alpha-D-manno-heptose-7-phosphate kinase
MIITRSPLRISIGGGGTDLPSYYRQRGGFLIAMALQKHVYVSLHQRFDPGYLLKYSSIEHGTDLNEIRHPIIREALKLMRVSDVDIEITSVADVPAGTGLGSSSSFTTALVRAIGVLQRRHMDAHSIAQLACEIELGRLGEPIGKQDQYAAAFGGLTAYRFNEDDSVEVETLDLSNQTYDDLENNTVMFFTGVTRSAGDILKQQDEKSKQMDADMLANLDRVRELGFRTRDAFINGNLDVWGEIMLEHWQAKKRRSSAMSNPQIDEWYDLALKNGAVGGKLVGAGGGGFLLFYAKNPNQLRQAMAEAGLKPLPIRMDVEGTKVLSQ